MTLTPRQPMTCGEAANGHGSPSPPKESAAQLGRTFEQPSSTLRKKGYDVAEGLHQRAGAVEQLAQNGFFFFNCKFETYVNVISNRNSCCKSDSSNFCCMILVFCKV